MKNIEKYHWFSFATISSKKAAGVVLIKENDPKIATKKLCGLKIIPDGVEIAAVYLIEDMELPLDTYHTSEDLKKLNYNTSTESDFVVHKYFK